MCDFTVVDIIQAVIIFYLFLEVIELVPWLFKKGWAFIKLRLMIWDFNHYFGCNRQKARKRRREE